MSESPGRSESGFTLIELMISLGLFALIAVAGLGLVQGILNIQGRTEARLDRLAELQRTMFLLTSDIDQIAQGQIVGDAHELSFTRAAPGAGGEPVIVRYQTTGNTLARAGGASSQGALQGVAATRWRFWDPDLGAWIDHWPVDDDHADQWPRAIAVEMQLNAQAGPGGTLRRVIVLPARVADK